MIDKRSLLEKSKEEVVSFYLKKGISHKEALEFAETIEKVKRWDGQ